MEVVVTDGVSLAQRRECMRRAQLLFLQVMIVVPFMLPLVQSVEIVGETRYGAAYTFQTDSGKSKRSRRSSSSEDGTRLSFGVQNAEVDTDAQRIHYSRPHGYSLIDIYEHWGNGKGGSASSSSRSTHKENNLKRIGDYWRPSKGSKSQSTSKSTSKKTTKGKEKPPTLCWQLVPDFYLIDPSSEIRLHALNDGDILDLELLRRIYGIRDFSLECDYDDIPENVLLYSASGDRIFESESPIAIPLYSGVNRFTCQAYCGPPGDQTLSEPANINLVALEDGNAPIPPTPTSPPIVTPPTTPPTTATGSPTMQTVPPTRSAITAAPTESISVPPAPTARPVSGQPTNPPETFQPSVNPTTVSPTSGTLRPTSQPTTASPTITPLPTTPRPTGCEECEASCMSVEYFVMTYKDQARDPQPEILLRFEEGATYSYSNFTNVFGSTEFAILCITDPDPTRIDPWAIRSAGMRDNVYQTHRLDPPYDYNEELDFHIENFDPFALETIDFELGRNWSISCQAFCDRNLGGDFSLLGTVNFFMDP